MSLEYNLSFFLLLVVGGRHDKEGESSVLFICLLGKWMSGIILNFHSFFLSIFYCEVGGGDDGNVATISFILGKVKVY